jgi:hypothetical protein
MVKIKRGEQPTTMDQARSILEGRIQNHPNCKSSLDFYLGEDSPGRAWGIQRSKSFWDGYFNSDGPVG